MVAPPRKSFWDQVMSGAWGPASDNVQYPEPRPYLPYDNGGTGPDLPQYDPFNDPRANWQPSSGSVSSYTPGMRDQAAYWLAKMWFGDDRRGVEKAKRLVDVASMAIPPAGAAIYADQGTRAARGAYDAATSGQPTSDAARQAYSDALWTAAFGLLPARLHGHGAPVPAKHISPHEFDRFDINKIGGGEGTAFEGPGIYAMDRASPTDEITYGPQFTKVGLYDVHSKKVLHYADALNKVKSFARKNLEDPAAMTDAADRYLKSNYDLTESGKVFPRDPSVFAGTGTMEDRKRMKDFVDNRFPEPLGPVPPWRYDINIHADPQRMPLLEKPLAEQPPGIMGALQDILSGMYTPGRHVSEDVADTGSKVFGNNSMPYYSPLTRYEAVRSWSVPKPALGYYPADPVRRTYLVGRGETPKDALAAIGRAAGHIKKHEPVRGINRYYDTGARDQYLQAGLPVLKYGDYDTETYYKYPNYVTFDDRLLEILRRARMNAGAFETDHPDWGVPAVDLSTLK